MVSPERVIFIYEHIIYFYSETLVNFQQKVDFDIKTSKFHQLIL
jgi:hypothetical protein